MKKLNKKQQVIKVETFDEDNQTFSEWLRSSEGLGYMKLFIFGNTIIVFLAISWPLIAEALDQLYYSYKNMI